ncbi:MAG: hypothetical protein Q8R33_00390 [Burkholderiales bacterium]|nr:hypothetical protein [Burkholderiales bacterium]
MNELPAAPAGIPLPLWKRVLRLLDEQAEPAETFGLVSRAIDSLPSNTTDDVVGREIAQAIQRAADWARLGRLIANLSRDEAFAAHEDVRAFAMALGALTMRHGPDGGIEAVLKELHAVFASRAGMAARAKGNYTRDDVSEAWQKLESDGIPIRSRVKRIADDEGKSQTQVRAALRASGLYAPKRGIRG